MAFKLTKTEIQQHDYLHQELERRQRVLEEAAAEAQDFDRDDLGDEALDDDVRATMEKVFEELNKAIQSYNELANEIAQFTEDIAGDRRSEFDDKSESWQESDKGQAVNDFIESWEQFSIEEACEDGDFEDVLQEFIDLPKEPSE